MGDKNIEKLLEALVEERKDSADRLAKAEARLQRQEDERKAERQADKEIAEKNNQLLLKMIEKLTQQPTAVQLQAPQAADGAAAVVQPIATYSIHRELSERMEKFVFDPEENKTFEKWFARYQTILETDAAQMTEAQRVCLMTEKLSTCDYDKFANTILPETNASIKFDEAVATLKRIFGRKQSLFALRYECMKIEKEEIESYAEFGARVNLHCEKFDVPHITADDFKVLIFVKGLHNAQDSAALAKLLGKLDQDETRTAENDAVANQRLNLQDAINIATRLQTLSSEKKMVSSKSKQTEVMALEKKSDKSSAEKAPRNNRNWKGSQQANRKPQMPCPLCGGRHWIRECEFKDKVCATCNKTGHKTNHCEAAKTYEEIRKAKRNSERHQSLEVSAAVISTRKFVKPTIDGTSLKLLLDSGSDWTIISAMNWKILGAPELRTCEEQAVSASGDPVKILGKFNARLKLQGREATGPCYVAESQLNVLGADWMEMLNLWNVPLESVCSSIDATKPTQIQDIKSKFPRLFAAGLGKCNRMKASLTLKPGTKPIFRKSRPVPFAAAQPIEMELRRKQCQGVFTPVSFAEFAAPIVVVKKKNGEPRICADYSTGLNEALEPNQHPLPTPEEIFSKLSQFRIFSSIDLSDAFAQIELDDDAKNLMAINTHCGLFRVNRLQQGVKTAPGIFQGLMDTMMAGADGVSVYMDDFIVGGIDEQSHQKNLFEALRRIEDYGFRLKIDKCSFCQEKITFLGHIIDRNGIRPDPTKLEVLQKVPAPTDVQQLQAFLGAVTWYGKFIPHLKDLRGPLDELLCQDEKFDWNSKRQDSFEALKKILASKLALTHYDPKKKIIVAADASSYGMGAVLLHEMPDGSTRPVLHAASSFNKAEKNYPQVQREARALTFAVKKFHRYIFGRRFELQTDHQPLLGIFGNKSGIPVHTASRLQRYALILLAYDFSIKYVDTKSFAYADFISRLIAVQERPDEEVVIATTSRGTDEKNNNLVPSRHSDKVNVKNNNAPGDDRQASVKNENAPDPNDCHTAETRLTVTDSGSSSCFAIETAQSLPVTFEAIRDETIKDETIMELKKVIETGWPKRQNEISNGKVAKFFVHRDSLMIIQNCVFFGDRIVIPRRYHDRILQTLHEGHPGIVRMKLLARSKVYWPGIDVDIEQLVRSCESCAVNSPSPRKCTLQSWPTPNEPWERVHIDFAGPVNGFMYFIMIDAFSNWPEVFKLSSTTAQKTIECVSEVFSRQGICKTLVSDNGRQLTSTQFERFCAENGIKHVTTAPFHPQSNGEAEKFVAVLKSGLKKLEGEGNIDHILRKFLMCYRYTPTRALGDKSPFQLMTGRVMRMKLDLTKPTTNQVTSQETAAERQFNSHHGAKWREFQVGEEVFVKIFTDNKWKWTPATVNERLGAVNYNVLAEAPSGLRRVKSHVNQMKRRYNVVENSNALLDEFDLEFPAAREVEPLIVPEATDEDDDEVFEDEDVFEDAESEEIPAAGIPIPNPAHLDDDIREPVPLPQTPRRSARTTKGIPPQRL
jgi:transposase InsO family protein